jgi:hypothetical protein
MTARIRWEGTASPIDAVASRGYAGKLERRSFIIYKPESDALRYRLLCLIGDGAETLYADDPEALKVKAERWLEEHVSSLGAPFEGDASPELAALRDERHRLLSLAAEILGSFEPHCAAPYCHDHNAQVVGEQYEDWCERAGVKSGQERTGDGEPR